MTPRTTSTYDGAELKTRSSRPGAYDAFAIPSLMFGKQERPVAAEPAPAPAPTSTPRASRTSHSSAGTYQPQPGSVGDQVIAHLQKHGGTLTTKQITELCGVERERVAGLMQRARTTGAVTHQIRDRKGYYSLPGTKLVAEALPPPLASDTAAQLPPHFADAPADLHAQSLQDIASNVKSLSKLLEQLQSQCLLLARAIHSAIVALPPTTSPELVFPSNISDDEVKA